MMPSESVLYPDLVLSLSSQVLREHKNIIKMLNKGDEIRFTARILGLGNEYKMHHLHAIKIVKTGNF